MDEIPQCLVHNVWYFWIVQLAGYEKMNLPLFAGQIPKFVGDPTMLMWCVNSGCHNMAVYGKWLLPSGNVKLIYSWFTF